MNTKQWIGSRLARLSFAFALAFPLTATAQTTPQKSPAGAPPLVDRELFFGNPEIAGAQLSPDGKYIAFLKPWKETRNVWVKKTGDPYTKAHLVTADPKRPIPGFFWSRDSKYILFVQDKDGDENYNVYAVDPSAPQGYRQGSPRGPEPDRRQGRPGDDLLPSRRATRTLSTSGLERPGRRLARPLQGENFNAANGPSPRRTPNASPAGSSTSQGKLRLAARVTDKGDTEILRVDPDALQEDLLPAPSSRRAGPDRFHKDGKRVYMETNKGDPRPHPVGAVRPGDAARKSWSSPTP